MRRKAKKTKHDSQTTRRKKHTTTATKTHSAGGKRSKKEDINHDNNHAATYDKRKAKQAGTMEERPPANSRHPCEAGSAHLQAHGPEARLHLALYFGVDNASRVPARRAQEGAPVPHRRHPELAQGTRTRTQSDAIGADLFSANVFAPHGTESHAPPRTAPPPRRPLPTSFPEPQRGGARRSIYYFKNILECIWLKSETSVGCCLLWLFRVSWLCRVVACN